jgi:hypothetical protein
VTGALDAFQWRVPVEEPDMAASVTGTSSSLDDLMQLDSVIDSMPDVDSAIDAQAAEATAPVEPEVREQAKPSAAERPERNATVTKTAGPPRSEPPEPVRETVRVGPSVGAKRTPAHVEIKTVTAMPLPTSKTSDRGSRRLIIDDSEPAEYDMDLEAEPSNRSPVKSAAEPKTATRVSTHVPASPMSRQPYDARTATIVIKPAAEVAGDRKSPAPMAAKAAAGTAPLGPNRRAEPAVLVPLHAPDDPGPELEDETGVEPIRPWPYRLK